MEKQFTVEANLGNGGIENIEVIHKDESFEIVSGEKRGIILDNGDGAWQLVKGDISQETVNIIGDAIEKHITDTLN